MENNWRNWCKFCGSSEKTIKFECSAEVKKFFKISSSAHKICSECSSYLLNFQEFVEKSKKIDKLFSELSLENEIFLDIERINEIRSKFQLDLIDDEEFENFKDFMDTEKSEDTENIEKTENTDIFEEIEVKHEPEFVMVDVKEEEKPIEEKKPSQRKNTKAIKKSTGKNSLDSDKSDDELNDPDYVEDRIINAQKRKALAILESKIRKENREKMKQEKMEKAKLDLRTRTKRGKLRRLIRITPSDEKIVPLICHICDEDFSKIGFPALDAHCKKNHDCKPSVPCICGLAITQYGTYYKHRKKCIRIDRGLFECDLCGNVYQIKKYLADHMNLCHINVKKHPCNECGKVFKSSSLLKKHQLFHHPAEPRERNQHCDQCEKSFDHIIRLKAHIRRIHQMKTRDQICHICSKTYKSRGELKAHLATTHAKTADFVCEINNCNKRFTTAYLLKIHQESHQPRNLFCSYCGADFTRQSILRNHIRYMHTHADVRPHKCPLPTCELMFKRKMDAKYHYSSVHDNSVVFDCFWCSSSLKSKSAHLRHHKNYHPVEFAEWRKKNPPKYGRAKPIPDESQSQ